MSASLQNVVLVNKELIASVKAVEAGLLERLDNLQLVAQHILLHGNKYIEAIPQTGHVDELSPNDSETHTQSVVKAHSTQFTPCSCSCHSPLAFQTPQWLSSTIGALHVKYSRTASQSSRACSRRSCHLGAEAVLKSQYYLPNCLLHRMMSLQFNWGPLTGHTVSLKTPRSISSKSTVFMLAQHGNIQGMKRLFEQRLASPFDISLEEGRSALHVSALQIKVIERSSQFCLVRCNGYTTANGIFPTYPGCRSSTGRSQHAVRPLRSNISGLQNVVNVLDPHMT